MAIDYISEFKEAMKNTTLELDLDKLDPDKDLSAQGVDSMDTINLLLAIGDYFHVDIIDSVGIEDLSTLNKIIALLQKHDAKGESH